MRQVAGVIILIVLLVFAAGDSSGDRDERSLAVPVAFEVSDGSFTTAIDTLSNQARLGVIVDGLPRGNGRPLGFKGTARGAVQYLSHEFDLSWELSPERIILFRMRFNRSTDRPQAIADEMRERAVRMLRLLREIPFDRNVYEAPAIQAIPRTLGSEAERRLKAEGRLAIALLPPEAQQAVVSAINIYTFSATEQAWDALYGKLIGLAGSYIWAEDRQVSNSLTGQTVTKRLIHHTTASGRRHVTSLSSRPISWGRLSRGDQDRVFGPESNSPPDAKEKP